MKSKIKIEPLSVRQEKYAELSNNYHSAVKICTDCEDFHQLSLDRDQTVTIVTLSTKDVRELLDHWGWTSSLSDLTHWDDKERVCEIMRKIPIEGRYPYVSYWASSLDELTEIERESDGEWYFRNHGDGWHRMIANLELGFPDFEVLFLNG